MSSVLILSLMYCPPGVTVRCFVVMDCFKSTSQERRGGNGGNLQCCTGTHVRCERSCRVSLEAPLSEQFSSQTRWQGAPVSDDHACEELRMIPMIIF